MICGSDSSANDEIVREPITYWKDAWRRFRKNPVGMISPAVVVLLLLMCVIGPMIQGYDYVKMAPKYKNQDPNEQFWWGTDVLDRDLFSRVWAGARVSFAVA